MKRYSFTLKSMLCSWYENLLFLQGSLLTLTDFYEIPALKGVAISKFRKIMEPYTNQLSLKIINHIYETTSEKDRGLRDVAVKWYLRRLPHAVFVQGKSITDAAIQVPAFASGVLTDMGNKLKRCPYCCDLTYAPGRGQCCECTEGAWG